MTVGEFIRLLSEDTSWTAGEDFGGDEDILLRKNCARIIHRYLQKVAGEPDETIDLPSASEIRDLNDCRICAPHIAQVIAKHMNKINNDVNIDRMTKVLMSGMTTRELNAILKNYEK